MSLDELKKVDHFYHLRCFGKGESKRRASSNANLDDIINYHKPKNMKATIDFYFIDDLVKHLLITCSSGGMYICESSVYFYILA